jgi:hypothetical protein
MALSLVAKAQHDGSRGAIAIVKVDVAMGLHPSAGLGFTRNARAALLCSRSSGEQFRRSGFPRFMRGARVFLARAFAE